MFQPIVSVELEIEELEPNRQFDPPRRRVKVGLTVDGVRTLVEIVRRGVVGLVLRKSERVIQRGHDPG